MLKKISPSDLIVGIPAGLVIFMSTVLFSTLLRQRGIALGWLELLILATDALIVGILAGLTRPRQGLSTALVAGVVCMFVFGCLLIVSRPGEIANPALFGMPGMIFSTLSATGGGWVGARLRKAI
jgi:hypothetical protein